MQAKPVIHSLLPALVLLAGSAPAWSQDAEDIIKYRHNVMKASGAHMAAMAAISRGKVDFTDQFVLHAEAVRDLTAMTGSLFPEGSDFGDTEAKETIWETPEDFAKRVKAAEDAAAALAEAARGSDGKAMKQGLAKLGKACKSCHKKYREEDD